MSEADKAEVLLVLKGTPEGDALRRHFIWHDLLERENAELRDKLSMVLPMALGYAHDHPVGDNLGKCRSARELLERGGGGDE